MATRGKFARVCIEMDLNRPLRPRFLLGKKSYAIEYESIHPFCFHCGRVDHCKELCRHKTTARTPHVAFTPNTLLTGDGLAVTDTPQPAPLSINGNLQHLEQGETHFGPWMMVTRRNRRPTSYRKPQTTGPQPNPNRFAKLDNIKAQSNKMAYVNKASSSSTPLSHTGPQIPIDPQHINATIKIISHSIGPAHSQENPSSHAPTVSHVQSLVGLTTKNTTDNSHMETSPTLIFEKPSLKESLSVSPEIPIEEPKVDCSPSPSRNPLNSHHNNSLRVEKSRARKPPNLSNRHGERRSNPIDSIHSQDGKRSTRPVDRARIRSHSSGDII
ncbi:hypothetical protein LOK49_LG11G02102 [Camellia lanceoleosa]|uniref:Uncharacterized protein n=1 Tax=Camellia lanceoleosa TaxID=1840588 RepID=A0ACC0G4X7_9ERIC|nr:hypothetical protein LOK49_LG11G02102 [Camellia lanceoleosa]